MFRLYGTARKSSITRRLAARVRAALGGVSAVTEIKMFGGLCFTVRGNMTVGVRKDA